MEKLSTHSRKEQITLEIINSLEITDPLREIYCSIWRNPSGGLRLTNLGIMLLSQMNVEPHTIKGSGISKPSALLALDHHMNSPYHIKYLPNDTQELSVFGDKEATILALYDDFNAYLKSIS